MSGDVPALTDPWAEFRRRRRTFLVLWLGGIPAIGAFLWLGGLALRALGARAGSPAWQVYSFAGSLLMTAWFVATVVTSFRYSGWRCPRCGKPFFRNGIVSNGFTRRCMHCGLPLGERADTDAV